MIMYILRSIRRLYKSIKLRIELWNHNEFTIADYFRKKGVRIGVNCRIYTDYFGTEPYLVKIGNHCTITQGVKFITHDGACWIFREKYPDLNRFGKIEIEDNCFIGVNSIILPNVRIGANSIIGAGSVVTKDIPSGSIAAGVPARVIGTIEKYEKTVLDSWKKLNLPEDRSRWENLLIDHFWNNSV